MRPKLKINNLTNLQDARYSAAVGFDFVSFSLERGSTKKLAPNLIWNIVNWLEGPKVILELNTFSIEELEQVDKVFTHRYITFPFEEWSDLLLQTAPSIILRGDENIPVESILAICTEAEKRDAEVKFELSLSSIQNLKKYEKALAHVFINFDNLAETKKLILDGNLQPYGISFGEEAAEDGLVDYEGIDNFIELLHEKYGENLV